MPIAAKLCIECEHVLKAQECFGPLLSPCQVWWGSAFAWRRGSKKSVFVFFYRTQVFRLLGGRFWGYCPAMTTRCADDDNWVRLMTILMVNTGRWSSKCRTSRLCEVKSERSPFYAVTTVWRGVNMYRLPPKTPYMRCSRATSKVSTVLAPHSSCDNNMLVILLYCMSFINLQDH